MSKRGIRLMLFIIAVLLFSCNDNKYLDQYDWNNIYVVHNEYQTENYPKYEKEHSLIKDTIDVWLTSNLKYIGMLIEDEWQIDSTVFFNTDSTRLYTVLLHRNTGRKDSNSDWCYELLGAKIDGQWYFYPGGNYVVPRQNYQDSMYAPLTFEELSYVAHKRPMAGMLLRDKDGKVVVNHERMNDRFFAGDGDFHKCNKVQSCYDSVIIEINKSMHTKKLDPEEVEDIKFSMASSVRPEEPFLPSRAKKEKSWWDILTKNDPEVKIFESEEWKNRHKKEK
jgi:hypothetical protein